MLHLFPFMAALPAAAAIQDFNPRQVPELAGAADTVLELSDRDGDREVTRAELDGFMVRMGAGLPPGPKVDAAMAELVLRGIRGGEAGELPAESLVTVFAAMDVNGDGAIEKGEPTLRILCNGKVGTRGVIHRIAHEVLLEEADSDEDGGVSADEIRALEERWAEGDKAELAAQWVANAKKREPENRNRMAPGVAFFTLEAELDQDRDGALDQERLIETFTRLDADGNGSLTLEERRRDGWQPPKESWREPSEARLSQPSLMPWQRSLEDALAVQKRTGQALLLCVNMDGETACDSLASWRYRDPGFAAVAAGYICLVVSPDDHQPRDYDDRGRRMVSPRLGRVTDREHIDLEPTLFERYFDGRRVAPRHVAIDTDGTVLFDAYLLTDPSVLDAKLAEHSRPKDTPDWGAMATEALAGFPDAGAREEMERRALEADVATRLAVAKSAGKMPDAGVICLFDGDPAVRSAAALAMVEVADRLHLDQVQRLVHAAAALDAKTVETIANSLWAKTAIDGDVRALGAVRSLWKNAWVSSLGAPEDWGAAARLSSLPVGFAKDKDAALSALEALDSRVDPKEATAAQCIVRAQALLDLAHAFAARSEDPRDAAAEAVVYARKGASASPARAQAIAASGALLGGDFFAAARAARMALVDLWPASSDPLTFYALKALQAGSTQAIYDAYTAQRMASPMLVGDAILAGRTLVAHPAGTEEDAVQLLNLMATLGDTARERTLLLECMGRFPASAELHQRYRVNVLRHPGAAAMGAAYDAAFAAVPDPAYEPTLLWFRGLGLLMAAEWEVQQDGLIEARANYRASLEAFGASIEAQPNFADSANHYRALGGSALAALEARAGEHAAARATLETYGAIRPASLDLKDGLGMTPREYASEVRGAAKGKAPAEDEPRQAPREGREKAGG